jgi:HPt (histidine-containing phosphotransfer) domain-containing protein
MNRYILSQADIDVSAGIERFCGNRELYEEMLTQFPSDPHFSQLCEALRAQDVRAAFSAAHSLKGTSGNLNMTRLYRDIQPLVEELRAGRLEGADALLRPVVQDYEAVVAAIAAAQ